MIWALLSGAFCGAAGVMLWQAWRLTRDAAQSYLAAIAARDEAMATLGDAQRLVQDSHAQIQEWSCDAMGDR